MAENIETKVLSVDVGGAITNIKEYKQHIDSLKGTLLGLEKGTEQYNAVATELVKEQQKLTEVMDVAKGKGEAVEGSYDNLSKTMSELKKQFKATGDEAERANLALKINDINNQLKDMDASVGVFSRNVGNYSQAYEEAFKTVIGSLDNVDGLLGEVAGNVNSLFPLIKQTTAAATAGLKGIKKAIATTGIGLLIVAVGELAAHFDDVRRAVGVTDDKFQEFKSTVTGVLKTIVAGFVGVGNSILQFLITPIKTFIEVVKGAGTLIKDVFTGNFKKIKEDAVSAGKAVTDALNSGIEFKANFNKGKEFADNLIQDIQDNLNKSDKNTVTVTVQLKLKAVDTSNLNSDEEDVNLKLRQEEEKQALKDQEKINKEYLDIEKDLYSELNAILDQYNKDYIKKFNEQQEEEARILEERKINIKSFVSSTSDIIGMVADAWESSIKSQIETGKISEEEGKKQFEQVKALQTSVAIINTLSAGVAALDKTLQAGTPWGVAAGIAQMVAVIGTGMAQVAKIQSTTLGTRSSQVTSVTTPNLGSIVNEYQPQYVSNITNTTELDNLANALQKNPIKAYVVESDISNAQGLARQREDETSW